MSVFISVSIYYSFTIACRVTMVNIGRKLMSAGTNSNGLPGMSRFSGTLNIMMRSDDLACQVEYV